MKSCAKSNEEVEKTASFHEKNEILSFTTNILVSRGIYV
jgi:hypothetical protein